MSIRKGQRIVAGAGSTRRNLGEVYYSQSSLATDNSGALPLFTGESVSTAMYPSLTEWVTKHTELQCTAEEYESALSTYGECPKYVLSADSLRLPKLANYVKMANASEGITQSGAGLPDVKAISNGAKTTAWTPLPDYAESVVNTKGYDLLSGSGTSTTNTFQYIENRASLSSEVYGNSDTVTPAHTTLYPWVFAYSAVIPASTAQAADFQNALSGKADSNLGNTSPSASFKEMAISWSMPDYSTFTTVAASTNFEAPSAGVISFVPATNTDTAVLINAAGTGSLSIAGKTLLQTTYAHNSDSGHPDSGFFPIDKGEIAYHTMTYGTVYFYPLKGA